MKSQHKLIYDKTTYVQIKIFTQVLLNVTQALLAAVVTFCMSVSIKELRGVDRLQTHTQTDGHRNLYSELAQRADSVKSMPTGDQ